MSKYAFARKDANSPEIVAAFERLGWTWLDLSRVGNGCPDGVAGRGGVNVLVEIKSAKGKLNDDQETFAASWRGDVRVVRCVEDVLTMSHLR